MSLDYDHIFGQIDKAKKAKKKRKPNPVHPDTGRRADGSIPWNSKLGIANRKRIEEENKKKEEEIERTGGRVSQRRYRRNPGGKNKPSLHRGTLSDMKLDEKTGRVTGGGKSGVGTPYKDETTVPKGGRATNVGTSQAAHSSGTLTNAERAKRKKEIADARKLTLQQREEKKQQKRRVHVSIGDLNADGKISDEERELRRQQQRKTFEIEAKERKAREEKKRKETEAKVTEGTRSVATGTPTVRTFEHGLAEVEEKKREAQRKRTGKKPGIDPDYAKPKKDKKTKPKKDKKTEPKEDKVDEEVDTDHEDYDDVYVVDYGDDDSDVGPITKTLWKSWLEVRKVSMTRMKPPKGTKQDKKRKIEQDEQTKRKKLIGTLKKPIKWNMESPDEEESWERFKIRQERSDEKRFAKTPTPKPEPEKPEPEKPKSEPTVKPMTPEELNEAFFKGKSLWKSWLEKQNPTSGIDWKFFNTRESQADEAIEPECRDMVGPLEDKERLTSSGKKSKERWLDEQTLV